MHPFPFSYAIYKGSFHKFWDWFSAYSSHRKELLLLIIVVDIKCDVTYRSGNTLRFPRVTREPPRTIVLRGLTLGLRLLAPPKTMASTTVVRVDLRRAALAGGEAVVLVYESACIVGADVANVIIILIGD